MRHRESEILETWKYRLLSMWEGARDVQRLACDRFYEDYQFREECEHECPSNVCFDRKCPCDENCINHTQDSEYEKQFQATDREELALQDAYHALMGVCEWVLQLKRRAGTASSRSYPLYRGHCRNYPLLRQLGCFLC